MQENKKTDDIVIELEVGGDEADEAIGSLGNISSSVRDDNVRVSDAEDIKI